MTEMSNDTYEGRIFAGYVEIRMREKRMSQGDLHRMSAVAKTTIARVLNPADDYNPQPRTIRAILEALDGSVDEFNAHVIKIKAEVPAQEQARYAPETKPEIEEGNGSEHELEQLIPRAKFNDVHALSILASEYEHGWGRAKDFDAAIKLYSRAANLEIGNLHPKVSGNQLREEDARKAIRRAKLRLEKIKGRYITVERFSELETQADRGNAEAQFLFGKSHILSGSVYVIHSDCKKISIQDAYLWLLKAAKQGFVESYVFVSRGFQERFLNAGSYEQNFQEAKRYALKAHAEGDANGTIEYAKCLATEVEGQFNSHVAVEYLESVLGGEHRLSDEGIQNIKTATELFRSGKMENPDLIWNDG